MGSIYIQNTPPPHFSEDVTATKADVLKGKTTITSDSDDEIVAGTLELTGSSSDGDVLSGKTYYNTDAKTKRTGTMPSQSASKKAAGAWVSNNNFLMSFAPGYYPNKNSNGDYPEVYSTLAETATKIGATASKIAANQTICGITGTFTNDSDAVAGNILTTKTAYVKGKKITGTMANQGAKTSALNCGGSYTIPAGYHNGSGKITVNSLSSQTNATASASHILSGKTAWVNGSKITGNIISQNGQTIVPLSVQQRISCSGKYMTGDIVINGFGNAYNPMEPVSCNLKALTGRTWNLIGTFPKPISDRDILVLYGWKGLGTAIYGDGFISEILLNAEYDIATANANYATKLKIVNESGSYKLYIYLTSSSNILYTCRAVMFEKK